jgi:hypothetical protein
VNAVDIGDCRRDPRATRLRAQSNFYFKGGSFTLEDAMIQVDPWEKAAECDRALRLTLDPVHRENLTNIRAFWISLAQERRFLSESEFAKQAEAIGRIHAELSAPASIH